MVMQGMELHPRDAETLRALTQQVACWARRTGPPDADKIDRRVGIGTGNSRYVTIPLAVCAEYGAPPFTSKGAAITCPTSDEPGRWAKWDILPSDVEPLNIADCSAIGPLPAPAGLTPTAGDGQVALAWSAVEGATRYQVHYRPATGGDWTLHPAAAATNATVTGLTNGTEYEFEVRAEAPGTGRPASPWSGPVTATPTAGGLSP